MKRSLLAGMSEADLVALFAELGQKQDRAELDGEISKLNRLMLAMRDVEQELKARPGDRRQVLSSLYGHENAWVRIGAAQATLAVNPKEARQQLERLAQTHEYPPSARARMTLSRLKDGTLTPS